LYGPPFALDWLGNPSPRLIDGRWFVALSLFTSVAIPPVLVYRTEALKKGLLDFRSNYLFGERTILAHATNQGPVLVDPYVGGFFRQHAQQGHRDKTRAALTKENWVAMARELNDMAEGWPQDWDNAFRPTLAEIAEEHRLKWVKETFSWPLGIPLCDRTAKLLRESLPPAKVDALAKDKEPAESFAKRALRSFTPPVVWKLGAKAKAGLK
jgi:hypothetical protein